MSRYRATMKDLLEKVYKEDGHQDVSSSKRMCRTIREDAQQIESKLNSMSPEDSLDTWWTNKLAVSANNLNKARDYIVNDVKEELEEARIISDISGISIPKLKKEAQPFNVKVDRVGPGMDSDYEVEFTGSETNLIKYAKKHLGFDGNNFSQLKRHLAMEEVELDEGKMKTIATMFDQGKSADEIAKALKLPVDTVKSILGEGINPYVSMQKDKNGKTKYIVLDKDEKEAFSSYDYKQAQSYMSKNYNKLKEQLDEFTSNQIKDLQKAYADLKGKTISPEKASMLSKKLDFYDLNSLRQLLKAKIPFVSTLARNKIYKKTGKFEEVEQPMPKEEPKKDDKKESENKDATIASLKDQISMLKTKLENEKNKAVKPEPNPDTGEVPLTVGVAYKHFKDKKEKEVKEDLEEATKPTEFKVKMKTPSGMKMVRVTVPIKDFVVDMAKIEDAARKKVKGDMINFDFVGDIKMEESVGQVQTRPDGKGNFNLMFRGKEIGYYHKERGKYVVYHSKEDGEYSESDVVSTPTQAKKIAYDNMTEADLTKSQIKQVHKVADDLPKKDFKDRYGKEKGDAVRFGTATNMVKKKLGIKEDRRLYVETIAGLKKKAEKSGMPYSILKKVYDRGMAAWKSGHRPGASQQQWAFARVNSFVTKSSGTWGGADKDLAKQVRGSK